VVAELLNTEYRAAFAKQTAHESTETYYAQLDGQIQHMFVSQQRDLAQA